MGLINGSVWAVAQSEQLVVAGSGAFDPVLRAWTRRGGALVLEMATPNQAGVLAVAVRGNRAAAGTFPGAVFIVDVLAAEVVHELQGHTAAVWSVVLDDAIVTGSWDGSIRIWDEETGECVQSIFVGPKIGGIATHGNLIAAGFLVDNSVRIFDRTTEETLAVIRDAGDDVHSVAMDARHLVSASNDKKVRVYAIPSFELLNVLEGHTSWVHSVAVAGNRVVSCSWDTTIIIWDCYTSDPLLMLHGHDNAILSVSIFGSDIVSGAWDFSVKTWDLHTGALKHSYDGTEPLPSTRELAALNRAMNRKEVPVCSLSSSLLDRKTQWQKKRKQRKQQQKLAKQEEHPQQQLERLRRTIHEDIKGDLLPRMLFSQWYRTRRNPSSSGASLAEDL